MSSVNIRSRHTASWVAACGICFLSFALAGAPLSDDRVILSPDLANSSQAIEMRERLKDPVQRKLLRAEQRVSVRKQNPDLARVLLLEPVLETQLIEVLTDQQMEKLERFYGERPAGASLSRQPGNSIIGGHQADADAATRYLTQIKELLGEDRFARYLDYRFTLRERVQATTFDALLPPSSRLTPDQKERLVLLLNESRQKEMESRMLAQAGALSRLPDLRADAESIRERELQRTEDELRVMQESSHLLLARLSEVLRPQQIDTFARMEFERTEGLRQRIQQMRARARMSPDAEKRPQSAGPPQRKAVSGPVSLVVSVKVNGSEAMEVVLRAENGQAATPFEGPDGLWIEATPTLYETGYVRVSFRFFEDGGGRRRPILGSLALGKIATPDSKRLGLGGTGAILTGSKGYSVSIDADATRLSRTDAPNDRITGTTL